MENSRGQSKENQNSKNKNKKKQKKKSKKEKADKKNNRNQESGKRVKDLEWWWRNSKVRGESKEVSSQTILQVKESKWENANKKDIGLYNRLKKRFILRKGKIYLLFREESKKVKKFI